jgi:uncharacterized protein YfdQ (DUF2303 family)
MGQVTFAEFLEDNYRDLLSGGSVSAADFLEMAQSFQATTKTAFSAGNRLQSGATQLVFTEETTASGGHQRKIEIPAEFELAIKPYEDCAEAEIKARFRYRAKDGHLVMLYVLNDPARHAEAAVREIAAQVAAEADRPVMIGVPS